MSLRGLQPGGIVNYQSYQPLVGYEVGNRNKGVDAVAKLIRSDNNITSEFYRDRLMISAMKDPYGFIAKKDDMMSSLITYSADFGVHVAEQISAFFPYEEDTNTKFGKRNPPIADENILLEGELASRIADKAYKLIRSEIDRIFEPLEKTVKKKVKSDNFSLP